MVTLNKIYTKTGDEGLTRLASGAPVSKTDLRVQAYGAVDELNAVLGVARLSSGQNDRIDAMLGRIQRRELWCRAKLSNCSTWGPIWPRRWTRPRPGRRCEFWTARSSGWNRRSTG